MPEVLFYADVLGVKARWRSGGRLLVADVYRQFGAMVERALTGVGPVKGGVQSDAVALSFPSTLDAVRFGCSLFMDCFEQAAPDNRLWLRGLIAPRRDGVGTDLATETPIADARADVSVRHFSSDLLDAINIEQAFRGARLLIAEELVDAELRRALCIGVGSRWVVPLKHLKHAPPPSANGEWHDVLYLLPSPLTEDNLRRRGKAMSERLRWAASDSSGGTAEELVQVSHLAVVWAESEAIAWSVGIRAAIFHGQPSGHLVEEPRFWDEPGARKEIR